MTKSGSGIDWPDLVTIVTGLAQLVKETLARPSTQERSTIAAADWLKMGFPLEEHGHGELERESEMAAAALSFCMQKWQR